MYICTTGVFLCCLLSTSIALSVTEHSTTEVPPGHCLIDGKLYEEGEEFDRDPDNCSGSLCMDGEHVVWDDACVFSWPPCDGIQQHVAGQCCPICLKTTTPRMETTTPVQTPPQSSLRDGQCEDNGVIYEDGEIIAQSPCYGSMCDDGTIMHWDHACFFSTPFCQGTQVNIPGQCCPECVRETTQTTPESTTPEGCMVNGQHYNVGADIPDDDPCKFCECTGDAGVQCAMMACDVPCPSPIYTPGQCCPSCPDGCNQDGVHYQYGDVVPTLDPCATCECLQWDSIQCISMGCPEPFCPNPVLEPGQCCPVCPPGCLGDDGMFYEVGTDVPVEDPCSFCHCSEDFGIQCAMMDCFFPCLNPIYTPGQCCPTCPEGCEQDGVHYGIDDDVPTKDPCEFCHCTQKGVICYYMGCAFPECDNPVTVPDQCCPVCPEPCELNGVIYNVGDTYLDLDRCSQCECTDIGPSCEYIECQAVNCINPVHRKGECCPVCPNGPNCAYGRRVISVGDSYSPRPLITCTCRTDPWEPLACCTKMIGGRKAKKILKRKSDIINPLLLQLLQPKR